MSAEDIKKERGKDGEQGTKKRRRQRRRTRKRKREVSERWFFSPFVYAESLFLGRPFPVKITPDLVTANHAAIWPL